jgi:hypothetical protein
MKFKNKDDEFEFEVLNLSDETYLRKMQLAQKMSNFNDELTFVNLKNAWNKWQDSTSKKRFKKKIDECSKILQQDELSYQDLLNILITLNSIKTHILIELQYYEPNQKSNAEFLFVMKIFYEKSQKVEEELREIIFKNKRTLNNNKDILEEIFSFFRD